MGKMHSDIIKNIRVVGGPLQLVLMCRNSYQVIYMKYMF